MAVVIKKYQSSEVDRAVAPVGVAAPQTALGKLADGISDVGGMFDNWQDEVDTADAKSADAAYSDLIRQELYADQTGFMYSNGSDAVNRRGSVSSRLEAEQKRILQDLSPAARARAQNAMNARYQGALQTVDQHTSGQRQVYLDNASSARIQSSINDAIYNPDKVSQSISVARQEVLDKAARGGWSPEQTKLALDEANTAIYGGVVARLANADPVAAMTYLRENKDKMNGSEVSSLEAKLVPMVRERAGRAAGAAAANGTALPRYQHNTEISFNMGPARPNKPDQPVLDVVGRAVQDVLGAGARVVVTSGKENPGNQHGSDRHKTGHAADIQVIRPDGTVVKSTDSDAGLIAKAAASLGAKGIGFGAEYMGGDHFHIDLVDPGAGQANTWASGGKAMRDEIVGIINGRPAGTSTIDDLLKIADPDERAAALSEYKLITGIKAANVDASKAMAADEAFKVIEGGGNINDLPQEFREHIGREEMNALRSYQEKVASKTPVVTDDQLFVRLLDMAATSPDAFMQQSPMIWRDSLDDADFKAMVKKQTDMKEGKRTAGTAGPAVSALRTAAATALEAAGLKDDPKTRAGFESGILRWSAEFTARESREPSPIEVNDRLNQMLMPVILDPKGFWNTQDTQAFNLDLDGEPLNPNDDITPQAMRDGALKLNGTKVSNEMLADFASGFNDRFKRAPTVKELIDGLIATGLYQ